MKFALYILAALIVSGCSWPVKPCPDSCKVIEFREVKVPYPVYVTPAQPPRPELQTTASDDVSEQVKVIKVNYILIKKYVEDLESSFKITKDIK